MVQSLYPIGKTTCSNNGLQSETLWHSWVEGSVVLPGEVACVVFLSYQICYRKKKWTGFPLCHKISGFDKDNVSTLWHQQNCKAGHKHSVTVQTKCLILWSCILNYIWQKKRKTGWLLYIILHISRLSFCIPQSDSYSPALHSSRSYRSDTELQSSDVWNFNLHAKSTTLKAALFVKLNDNCHSCGHMSIIYRVFISLLPFPQSNAGDIN